jgi:hypothetical protein
LKGSIEVQHFRAGRVLHAFRVNNLIVTTGKALIANLLIAVGNAPHTLAIGTGAVAAGAGDIALGAQTHTGTCDRSIVNTTVTGDTAQYEYIFTFTGGATITEAGLFYSTTLVARQVFTGIPVLEGDGLLLRWKLQA